MATLLQPTDEDPSLFRWFDQMRGAALLEACRSDDQAIARALARFEDGTFGDCLGCGEQIDRNYLAVHPWAERCPDCQPDSERIRPRASFASLRTQLEEEGGRLLLAAREIGPERSEYAAADFLEELAGGLSDEERVRLHMIIDAMDRLSSGSFGSCAACGEPIDQARFETQPWLIQCGNCTAGPRVIRFELREKSQQALAA